MSERKISEPQHWVVLDTNAVQVEEGNSPFDGILGTMNATRATLGYHLAIPQMVLLEHQMRGGPEDREEKFEHARTVWEHKDEKHPLQDWACRILPLKEEHHAEILIRDLAKRAPFDNRGRGARDTRTWLAILDFLKERPNTAQLSLITNDKDFYLDKKTRTTLHPDLVADLTRIGFPAERIRVFNDTDVFFERVIQPSSEYLTKVWGQTACEVIPKPIVIDLDERLRAPVKANQDLQDALPLKNAPENYEFETEQYTLTGEAIVKFGEIEALSSARDDSCIARFKAQILVDIVDGGELYKDDPLDYDYRRTFDCLVVAEWNPTDQRIQGLYMDKWVANLEDSMASMMCRGAWEYEQEEEQKRQKRLAWKRELLRRAQASEHGIPPMDDPDITITA